ncbi:hypothetical protein TrRE_jg1387, partial [Triparma retinervis]
MLKDEQYGGPDSSSGTTGFVNFPVPVDFAGGTGSPVFVHQNYPGERAKGGDEGAPTVPFSGLAFTAPFRILSDEGVSALKLVIKDNEEHCRSLPGRAAKSLRGLGYRSKFIRDLNYSPSVLSHLSKMSGCPLGPHNMPSNLSQTNFGEIGSKKPVDVWHIDSVDYVLVILLSDPTGMVGGELQVARLNGGDAALAIQKINREGISEEEMDVASYPGEGYGILMQGSRIAHSVSEVKEARERRLTVVNSYHNANPFKEDKTRFATFSDVDGFPTARYEYARHKAWR